MKKILLLFIPVLLVFTNCNIISEIIGNPEEPNGYEKISAIGTITYVDLEGGFYGIITDSGEKYVPTNLKGNYSIDGLKVKFSAYVHPEISSYYQWGTLIELIEIEKIKQSELVITKSEWSTEATNFPVSNTGHVYLELEGYTTDEKVTVLIYGDGIVETKDLTLDENKKFNEKVEIAFSINPDNKPHTYSTVVSSYNGNLISTSIELKSPALYFYENPEFTFTGTVTYIEELEGQSFFGIIGDDGNNYLPINLPPHFHIDKLEVEVSAILLPEEGTTLMWGRHIEITNIKRTNTNALVITSSKWSTEMKIEGENGIGCVYLELKGYTTNDRVTYESYGDGVISEEELILTKRHTFSEKVCIAFRFNPDDSEQVFETTIRSYSNGNQENIIKLKSPPLKFYDLNRFTTTGIIKVIDENGYLEYGILADDMTKYSPIYGFSIPEELKIDGLPVKFTATDLLPYGARVTLATWGEKIRLEKIEKLEIKHNSNPE